MRIDHVIYATSDLDAAADRFETALEVPVLPGGRHEGIGTHNRIIPLGGGYLELLAVADPEEAASSSLGRLLQARIDAGGDGWLGWCVAVDDVAGVAARLATSITTIARQGLSARLTALDEALCEPYLPFFIERDEGIADPGAGGDAGGITWIEVGGDAARLRAWLDGVPLPTRVVAGPPAVRAVGVGDRELRI